MGMRPKTHLVIQICIASICIYDMALFCLSVTWVNYYDKRSRIGNAVALPMIRYGFLVVEWSVVGSKKRIKFLWTCCVGSSKSSLVGEEWNGRIFNDERMKEEELLSRTKKISF